MMRILALLFILGCGSGHSHPPGDGGYGNGGGGNGGGLGNGGGGNGGSGGGGNSGGRASFQEVLPVLEKSCQACHANSPWLANERGLKSSSVKARVANRTMPPLNAPQKMSEAERQKVLSFF